MPSLAVKYRPKSFGDVTEQSVVADMLKGICESDELQCRNFLLTGPAGVGKTTIARIMANIWNGGKGEPTELDAASNSGVENIRELIRQARMLPIGTKYKIFILDEVHALSSSAWQALLLPLESGVGNSIFLMATTNPEKIPPTIISRVQTFQLSKISLKGIESRLRYIVDRENEEGQGITYTDDALNYIAKLANGGMRDSISLLEKALTYSKDLTTENLMKSLNLPNYDDFFELLGAYAKRDNRTIAEVVDRVYNSGVNFLKWFNDFHAFVINIVKYIFLQDISMTMIPSIYQDKISNYNVKHSTICLKLANKLVTLNHELKTSQYLQELVLTYLCSTPKKGE